MCLYLYYQAFSVATESVVFICYFVVSSAILHVSLRFLHSLRLFKFKCWLFVFFFLRRKLLFERVSAFAMLVDGRGPGITI